MYKAEITVHCSQVYCVLSQESPLLVSPRDFASLLRDRISIALAERAGALIQEGEREFFTQQIGCQQQGGLQQHNISQLNLPLAISLALACTPCVLRVLRRTDRVGSQSVGTEAGVTRRAERREWGIGWESAGVSLLVGIVVCFHI